jgi:hypothetical protein
MPHLEVEKAEIGVDAVVDEVVVEGKMPVAMGIAGEKDESIDDGSRTESVGSQIQK